MNFARKTPADADDAACCPCQMHAFGRTPQRGIPARWVREPLERAFTLLEVMIAVGILFMCLFGVLALVSNSLTSARKLQQHRSIDTDSVAGLIYTELVDTNQVAEGPVDVDLGEMYPGYKCDADLTQVESNGLCDVHFTVRHNLQKDLESDFLIYLPNMKQGGISSSLPRH